MDTPEALAKAIVQAASPQSATIEWQHALERGILTALRAAEAAAYERAAQAVQAIKDDYPDDVFVGDTGKACRHIADRALDAIRDLK